MMKSLQEFKAERMKDPAFVKAYAESEPEMNIIRAIVDARNQQKLTQKELALHKLRLAVLKVEPATRP